VLSSVQALAATGTGTGIAQSGGTRMVRVLPATAESMPPAASCRPLPPVGAGTPVQPSLEPTVQVLLDGVVLCCITCSRGVQVAGASQQAWTGLF